MSRLITREWIHDNKTPRGSWNKKQIEALGLSYPPRQGWIDKLHKTKISEDRAVEFEQARVSNKKNAINSIDKAIEYLSKNANKIDSKQIVLLRMIEKKFLSNRGIK